GESLHHEAVSRWHHARHLHRGRPVVRLVVGGAQGEARAAREKFARRCDARAALGVVGAGAPVYHHFRPEIRHLHADRGGRQGGGHRSDLLRRALHRQQFHWSHYAAGRGGPERGGGRLEDFHGGRDARRMALHAG